MKNRNRSNVLLVEILIAVLFFMLSATVVLRVFATAHNLTVRSEAETAAIVEAQNVAEAIVNADDVDAMLEGLSFMSSHGVWTRNYGDFTIYVAGEARATEAGELWEGEVRGYYGIRNVDTPHQEDEELFSLPCVRYRGV